MNQSGLEDFGYGQLDSATSCDPAVAVTSRVESRTFRWHHWSIAAALRTIDFNSASALALQAREFYEKAIKLLLKHDEIEAQGKLDQALRLYPAFAEALTMRGSIQLDHNQWEAGEQGLQAAV